MKEAFDGEKDRSDEQRESEERPVKKYYNVFDAIEEKGHDEDFVPTVTDEFYPTDAQAGSKAKVEVLAERVNKGLPLWHPEDKTSISYRGLFNGLKRSRE